MVLIPRWGPVTIPNAGVALHDTPQKLKLHRKHVDDVEHLKCAYNTWGVFCFLEISFYWDGLEMTM